MRLCLCPSMSLVSLLTVISIFFCCSSILFNCLSCFLRATVRSLKWERAFQDKKLTDGRKKSACMQFPNRGVVKSFTSYFRVHLLCWEQRTHCGGIPKRGLKTSQFPSRVQLAPRAKFWARSVSRIWMEKKINRGTNSYLISLLRHSLSSSFFASFSIFSNSLSSKICKGRK